MSPFPRHLKTRFQLKYTLPKYFNFILKETKMEHFFLTTSKDGVSVTGHVLKTDKHSPMGFEKKALSSQINLFCSLL